MKNSVKILLFCAVALFALSVNTMAKTSTSENQITKNHLILENSKIKEMLVLNQMCEGPKTQCEKGMAKAGDAILDAIVTCADDGTTSSSCTQARNTASRLVDQGILICAIELNANVPVDPHYAKNTANEIKRNIGLGR